MKIVFMGTPEFAIPTFKILLENKYEIQAAVTVPDKMKGRGLQLSQSAVKRFAIEHDIEVLQPEDLKDKDFIEKLSSFRPDLIVVVAFRILPPEIFKIPKHGSINLHASLLPKYRGAAPINRAIMNGEKETGVTTFFLKEKVDTGNMILQDTMKIEETDDAGSLHNKLSEQGAKLVLRTVKQIESGNINLQIQDEMLASKAPKIHRDDCRIDWNQGAREIYNFIRGLSPYPGAFTGLNNKLVKILKSKKTGWPAQGEKGAILIEKQHLFVSTGDELLEILELKPEGKRNMTASDFINGLGKTEDLKFE